MGDTGSLALGGALAGIATSLRIELLLIPLGGLFVIISASVILQVAYFKITGGKRIFKMAPLQHHFELMGWGEVTIVLRFWIIVLACVLSNITAQAHPGHEGGHDGDEFVWTADHLASHPGATLMALAAASLIAWGAYRFLSASQRQLKAAAARSQVADKTV
jgi:hypothetical protein